MTNRPSGIPTNLVRLRALSGMSQRELSQASGVSLPQIGRYEVGISHPRMTALIKMSVALGCTVDDITAPAPEVAVPLARSIPDKPAAYIHETMQHRGLGFSPSILGEVENVPLYPASVVIRLRQACEKEFASVEVLNDLNQKMHALLVDLNKIRPGQPGCGDFSREQRTWADLERFLNPPKNVT